jgi:hypothetical protein
MTFPKTKEYVDALYSVTQMLMENAKTTDDPKLKGIARLVYMYFLNSCNELKLDASHFSSTDNKINMAHIVNYISHNNIQLYDLKHMSMSEMNPSNSSDIERYTLSHILYIAQNN